MNIKALITTLAILGSSSAAMARPVTFSASAEASWSYGYHDRDRSRPVVIRDHRYRGPAPVRYEEPMMFPNNNRLTQDASVYEGPLATRSHFFTTYYGHDRYRWMSITAPTRIELGRQYVTELPDLGPLSVVRLQNVAGTTNVHKVLIRYKNGQEQLVYLNQRLSRWNPSIDIHLEGHGAVHGFVLYGSTGHGSAYRILAQ